MDTKPKRRWYQFSLRTMFVLVFLMSMPLAWVGYQLKWIRQRQGFAKRFDGFRQARHSQDDTQPPAPCWLGYFGEEGATRIYCPSAYVREAKALFPESQIIDTDSLN